MRALIVGNGEPPSRALFDALLAAAPDLLLCADGGADTVRRYGAAPDAVVGDLDSASSATLLETPAQRQVRIDADDTGTDLNKVLRHAIALGVTAAVLTGVTGRRTDHTLWNLSLLKRYADRLQLLVVDDYCHIRLLGAGTVTHFHARIGLRLSLSPLDGAAYGVTTAGLRWSLTGENLVPGQRDGISNEVVTSPVSIRVDGPGDLLLMVHTQGETAEIDYFDPS
ncbi:MAG: thiamine diphosphokinase [bacterium]|nr:thiamine diphosphokinase [bacterium]